MASSRIALGWLTLALLVACSDDTPAAPDAAITRDDSDGNKRCDASLNCSDGGRSDENGAATDAGPTVDAGMDAALDGSAGAGGMAAADAGGLDAGDAAADSSTNATDAGDASSSPDASTACSGPHDAFVLVVFDQSSSMQQPWSMNAGSKLDVARNAVRASVAAQPETLRAGVLFFPTAVCVMGVTLPGGAVAPFDQPPQISFRAPGPFITAWDAKWATSDALLGVGTPLQEAFDRTDLALGTADGTAPKAVILITDGEGNCVSDESTGIPFDTTVNRATAWAARGIATHVVAMPGASGLAEPTAIATAAGTELIIPNDTAALESALTAILSKLTCAP